MAARSGGGAYDLQRKGGCLVLVLVVAQNKYYKFVPTCRFESFFIGGNNLSYILSYVGLIRNMMDLRKKMICLNIFNICYKKTIIRIYNAIIFAILLATYFRNA